MTDIENRLVARYPDPESDLRQPERDNEDRYEAERTDRAFEQDEKDQALVSEINRAIVKLNKAGVFDMQELIALLKKARNRIDPTPPLGRRQAG